MMTGLTVCFTNFPYKEDLVSTFVTMVIGYCGYCGYHGYYGYYGYHGFVLFR